MTSAPSGQACPGDLLSPVKSSGSDVCGVQAEGEEPLQAPNIASSWPGGWFARGQLGPGVKRVWNGALQTHHELAVVNP